MARNWFDLCNFYSKVIFFFFFFVFEFLFKKLFFFYFFFFAEFELLMFHNKLTKTSEKLNQRNLLKISSKLPTLQISA